MVFDDIFEINYWRPALNDEKLDIWFICLSPMTHDPTGVIDILQCRSIFKIAIFHDLIPAKMPGRYLSNSYSRSEYLVCMSWLKNFDVFAANSKSTAAELVQIAGVDPSIVFVSGVAIRDSIVRSSDSDDFDWNLRKTLLVIGGGDPRKNPECALLAHARSAAMSLAGIFVVVSGEYLDETRSKLRSIYSAAGGDQKNLRFSGYLKDPELSSLYECSIATIVPSRAEGFSIPIVESSANGTPALASDIPAHAELLQNPDWRFDPEDPMQLLKTLDRWTVDKVEWSRARSEQAPLWRHFTGEIVGDNFAQELISRVSIQAPIAAPAILGRAKPSLAILSPLPPAQSGVADYTASSLRPLQEKANLHFFTPTPNATIDQGWASLRPVSAARTSKLHYDARISVIGNSHFHSEIFEILLEQGGACIAHDARQIDFYVHLKGIDVAVAIATQELGRNVTSGEVTHWLHHQRDLPIPFLSEIARTANPLIVHSPTTAKIIEECYGKNVAFLPFAQYRIPLDGELKSEYRAEVKKTLGFNQDDILITTFGGLGLDRGIDEILWAVKLLRTWSIKARLVFCGSCDEPVVNLFKNSSRALGIGEFVTIFDGRVDEETYRKFLIGSDIGVQLRTYFMGGLSGALNDCIAAALPSVANDHLADAMQAPSYIRRIPDNLSSVLLAEAILDILESGENRNRPLVARAEFHQTHSAEAYCAGLLALLNIG